MKTAPAAFPDLAAELTAALSGNVALLEAREYRPDDSFWRAAADHQVDLLLLDVAGTSGADRVWTLDAQTRARTTIVDQAALRSLRDRELCRVLDALGSASVPCLLLKGAALAHTIYRHPHVRRRSDADLLVRAQDRDRASSVLAAHGYARESEISGRHATAQMHFDRPDCADHRYALDVHWRIVNTHAVAPAIAFEEFSARRSPVAALGPNAWTLCTSHALALACIHRVAHHQDSDHLLWLWDVHLLASATTGPDIDVFVQSASRLAIRAVCADTLESARALFRTAAARQLIDLVRPEPGAAEEASARFLGGGLSLADILQSDIVSLGWRERVELLREHLFPSAAYMRSRYDRWPAVFLPAAYVHRIVRGAPKWLRRP